MKKRLLNIITLICAVMLLCMEGVVFTYAGGGDLLVAPVELSVQNEADGVKISWSVVEKSVGYKLYRAKGESEPELLEYISGEESTFFKDETAESGVLYKYTVKPYNLLGDGEESEAVQNIFLSLPEISKASNGYNGIDVKWTKVKGAESYAVYRKNGNTELLLSNLKGENNCSYTDKSVETGKRYRYYVVANCSNYTSDYMYKVSSVYMPAPVVKTPVIRNGYIEVSWKKADKAQKYKIYRKAGTQAWKGLKTVNSSITSFKDISVASGTVYSYRVVAIKGNDKSGYSKNGAVVEYMATPQNITVNNTTFNGFRVKWNKVSGAESYRVYRKDNVNKSWKLLDTVKSNTYKDLTAANAKQYTYTVRANGENGGRSYYLKGTKSTCIYKPATVKLTSSTNGVTVNWSKIPEGNGYRVYRKDAGASSYKLIKKITSNSTTSYTDTSAVNGKNYIYTVRAVKGKINGSYEKNGYFINYVTAPTLTLKHSPKGIVLSWTRSPIGTGYEIQRKGYGDKSYATIAVLNGLNSTTLTDTNVIYGKYNYYRVKVICDKDLKSSSQKLFGIDPNKKMVALTYDDGPYSSVTNSILDTLKKHNSRATFFVVGSRVNTYRDCIAKANKQGCEIANHSYNHTILTGIGASSIQSEISQTNTAIKNVICKEPVIVRAPGGATNSTVKNNIKYPIISWSVDTLDWKYRNSSSVVSKIKANVGDGSIVLMHDLYESTATATKEIVPWLIDNGYQIVTVSEMMAVKGIDMQPGAVYYSAK